MELSKLVKGITANDVGNTPGVSRDGRLSAEPRRAADHAEGGGSGFGQPKFSREAIAEFQIVTNMFDITQGRSSGIQVQAISRSGTNNLAGSVYGFFRSDKFNAPDPVAKRVLPYQNQQVGGALGGPIVKDKIPLLRLVRIRARARNADHLEFRAAGTELHRFPYKNSQKSLLARVDDQMTSKDRLTIRGSRWDQDNPFVSQGGHPSNAYVSTQNATNIAGIWSKVLSDTRVQEVRFGFNNFDWSRTPQEGQGTIEYDFAGGLTVGKPYNYPQLFHQNNFESRYDLSLHRNTHDIKFGGEFIYVTNKGDWFIQQVGRNDLQLESGQHELDHRRRRPVDVEHRGDSSSVVREFDQNFHPSDWGINVPRPTGRCGSATTGAPPAS
jgi:hypothetical protein